MDHSGVHVVDRGDGTRESGAVFMDSSAVEVTAPIDRTSASGGGKFQYGLIEGSGGGRVLKSPQLTPYAVGLTIRDTSFGFFCLLRRCHGRA